MRDALRVSAVLMLAFLLPTARAQLSDLPATSADATYTGPAGAHLGFVTYGAGNWDSDPLHQDFIIGGFTLDSNTAKVYVKAGQVPGGSLAPVFQVNNLISGDWGPSAAFVGDLDGGGRDDIAIGEFNWDDMRGRVLIFFAERHQPPSGTTIIANPALEADLVIQGSTAHRRFGWSIAPVGDANGGGFPDFIVGEPGCDDDPRANPAQPCTLFPGAAHLILGGPDGLIALGNPTGASAGGVVLPAWPGGPAGPLQTVSASSCAFMSHTGNLAAEHFGWSVAGLGNIGGSSLPEYAVGAIQARKIRNSDLDELGLDKHGYVQVFNCLSQLPIVEIQPPGTGTTNIAYDFGFSVSAIGDVTSDGRSELLVGAPGYYHPVGHELGMVYMYSGGDIFSWTGSPNATPVHGDTSNLLGELSTNARLGWSVAGSTSSLNSDDQPFLVPDFVAGAYVQSGSDGRAYVMSGIKNSATTFGVIRRINGESAGATGDKGRFGWTVSIVNANGSGLPDVLVGAMGLGSPAGTEHGRAYLFFEDKFSP